MLITEKNVAENNFLGSRLERIESTDRPYYLLLLLLKRNKMKPHPFPAFFKHRLK